MRFWIGLLAALIIAGPNIANAQSQQPTSQSELQAFFKSDFYKGLISRALAGVPPAIFQRCPALASKGSTVTVLRPLHFARDGFPDAGSWKQSFPVSGCGDPTVLNFYFSADADEKVNTLIGFPGTTRTDLTLQRDALPYVNAAASVAAKPCRSFAVKQTKFEGFGVPKPPIPDPGATSQRRAWWETWTLIGCGHIIDVPIDFVPDATGTQIIQPGGAILRP